MADSLAEHLRDLSRQAGEAIRVTTDELRSLKEQLLGDKKGSKHWLRSRGFFARRWPTADRRSAEYFDRRLYKMTLNPGGFFSGRRLVADHCLSQYFELRLHELTLNAFCRLVGLVLGHVATAGDKLRNLTADFNRLIEQFSAAEEQGAGAKGLGSPQSPVPSPQSLVPSAAAPAIHDLACAADRTKAMRQIAAARISANKTELLAQMEQALEEDLRHAATTDGRDARSKLAVVIRRTAQTLIMRMLKQYAVDEATAALEGRPHEAVFELPSALQQALPRRFTACGGQRRLLVIAPKQLAPLVAAQLPGNGESPAPTVLADADSDMLVCYEVENQPLPRLADKVLDQRFQAVEAARASAHAVGRGLDAAMTSGMA